MASSGAPYAISSGSSCTCQQEEQSVQGNLAVATAGQRLCMSQMQGAADRAAWESHATAQHLPMCMSLPVQLCMSLPSTSSPGRSCSRQRRCRTRKAALSQLHRSAPATQHRTAAAAAPTVQHHLRPQPRRQRRQQPVAPRQHRARRERQQQQRDSRRPHAAVHQLPGALDCGSGPEACNQPCLARLKSCDTDGCVHCGRAPEQCCTVSRDKWSRQRDRPLHSIVQPAHQPACSNGWRSLTA